MRRKILNEIRRIRRLKRKMAEVQQRNQFAKRFKLKQSLPVAIELDRVCAICGEREATTRDHVPPKAIFPKPKPNNLVTVPACKECNNGASDYDDLFKVYLSMHTAGNSEIAMKLFREKTARTLKRNQALLNKIREESRKIPVVHNNGRIETRTGILWDADAHDAVIERTIRGLYFHHVGQPVPKDAEVCVQWLHGVPKEIEEKIHLYKEVVIGDNQFVYKYIFYPDDPRHSLWIFEFYGTHWASGYTSPV